MRRSVSRPVWVFDQLLGHLAVADRAGAWRERFGRPTRLFLSPTDAIPLVEADGPPAGLMFGEVDLGGVLDLFRIPELRGAPSVFLLVSPACLEPVFPDGVPDWFVFAAQLRGELAFIDRFAALLEV